jgi:predicted permease
VLRPPRLPAALLARAVPPAHRDAILGDLAEVHAARAADRGLVAAWLWYWTTAVPMAAAFAAERMTARIAVRRRRMMRGFATDVRFAWRMMRKSPWMSAAAVLSLAGAMAVTIAGFSLIWATHFAELPFVHGDRIVAVRDLDERLSGTSPRLAVYRDWLERQRAFDVIGAAYSRPRELGDGSGGLARYRVCAMTASGFRVTGVGPLLGRTLTVADEAPGARPVVVLGFRLWASLFGSDPGAIGRSMVVDRQERLIVGVMPDGFRFPMSEDLWVPFPTDAAAVGAVEPRWVHVFGRMAAGVTRTQARDDLESIRAAYAAAHPEDIELQQRRTSVVPYVQSDSEPGGNLIVLAMFAFILLVLAVACASVANLLLCRTMARRGEMAVRAALGASRRRLVTQLLIEALMLTTAAAAMGVAAAQLGLAWFDASVPLEALPFWVEFDVNPPTVVFAIGAAFAAAVLAGIAPALRATGGGMHDVLQDQQRGTSGFRFGSISGALTVLEVALAVAFLAAAGLAARSLLDANGTRAELPGGEILVADVRLADEFSIRPDGRVIASEGAIPPDRWHAVAEEIRGALKGLAGVREVALADRLPVQQHSGGRIEIEGSTAGEPTAGVRVASAQVTPELFAVFGGRLLAGRPIARADTRASEPVALVNRQLAERFFGGENPVGRRFRPVGLRSPAAGGDPPAPWITIVGVIGELPMNPAGDRQPGYYRPFAQGDGAEFQIAVRAGGAPTRLAAAVRETVTRIDPRIEISGFQTHEQDAKGLLVGYEIMSLVFMSLGGAALFLAAAGLYAVMSFSVTQRTREIGIRLALGARGSSVVRVVMARGLRQIAIGLALGSAGGWALMRLISLIPIGMSSMGPAILAAAAAIMLVAGTAACIVPMARTLRIAPVEALRHD